jgi:hypothetical protein
MAFFEEGPSPLRRRPLKKRDLLNVAPFFKARPSPPFFLIFFCYAPSFLKAFFEEAFLKKLLLPYGQLGKKKAKWPGE